HRDDAQRRRRNGGLRRLATLRPRLDARQPRLTLAEGRRTATATAAAPITPAPQRKAVRIPSTKAAWAWCATAGPSWEARASEDRACSASGAGRPAGCRWAR